MSLFKSKSKEARKKNSLNTYRIVNGNKKVSRKERLIFEDLSINDVTHEIELYTASG